MQQTESNVILSKNQRQTLPKFLARYIFLGLLFFGLLWLLIKGILIGLTVRSLLSYQTQAEAMLNGGLTAVDANEAEALILDIRQDIYQLESELAVFYPLMTQLGWVPKAGPTLVVVPELMEMAIAGSDSAAYAIRSLKPALSLLQDSSLDSSDQIAAILQIINDAEPDLSEATRQLQRVEAARAKIGDISEQPWRVKSLLNLADEWLPVAQEGLQLLPVLPEMAGLGGAKHYLVLAQNEDELRASGGFISSAGILTVENGRITQLNLEDAYLADDFSKPYGDPPTPLFELMQLELFVFRDANFWPDFPTSALQAMNLYAYGKELPPLDGVIALNQSFVQTLLAISGPIQIDSLSQEINQGNVIQVMQESYTLGEEGSENWFRDRKNFIGLISQGIQARLLNDISQVDMVTLAEEITKAVDNKTLQLFMTDPNVAAVLNTINWDGRVENPGQSDFLLIVDNNMGFNKANLLVDRTFTYDVTISDNLTASGHLEIQYTHQGTDVEAGCHQYDYYEVYISQPSYMDLADLCYWNYLRLYTPEGTTLIASTQSNISGDQLLRGESWTENFAPVQNDLDGWEVFENFILVDRGTVTQVEVEYNLPSIITSVNDDQYQYALSIGKQSGVSPEKGMISITLPPNATLISTTPNPSEFNGRLITFETTLRSNMDFSVLFEIDQ